MDLRPFARQTWALSKKNLKIVLVRCWLSTLIRALVFPILFLTLLLEIPNLARSRNVLGVAQPAPLRSLADSMTGNKKLAIVELGNLGSEFPPAIERLTKFLTADNVVHLDNEDQIRDACQVDYQGNSQCHAVVIFKDSPTSGRVNATWNYTIKADPSRRSGGIVDVFNRDGTTEGFYLPLQASIDNAITNSSVVPETFSYAYGDQAKYDRDVKRTFLSFAASILGFVFVITMIPVSHHVSSMMASERESGLSQLMDGMGGGLEWARVMSFVLTFDILYLPLWIILGSLFSSLLLTTSSPAIAIFWQILTGWAITHASVFATVFFKSSAQAGVFVPGITFLLGVAGAVSGYGKVPPSFAQIAGLGFFFPSMNYVFFVDFMVKSEFAELPVNLASPIPAALVPARGSPGSVTLNWVSLTGPYFLWIFLVIQILGYPLLAVLSEKYLHGNNQRRRGYSTTPEAASSHAAIETTELEKYYRPSIWRRIFCCCRTKKAVKAVDGLNLVSEKHQILCLLGPNGSGKTTTLEMIAGFHAPTSGSININAAPSELGICPQKNVLWANLTVAEHLDLWNSLKGVVEEPAALERLMEKCDLTLKKASLARNLSGGMKRKLQLACMLVGGSSVCLLDEVTSGLDPISRRVIWNAVLGERSRRTMIFTTHFLDECEVLSDHIVIVSQGKLKCQGTPSDLKNQYGGGYRVHAPKDVVDMTNISYPVTNRGDQVVISTPDSTSAAKVFEQLKMLKDDDIYITGPTVEDVFLNVSAEEHVLASNGDSTTPSSDILSNPGSAKRANTAQTQMAFFFGQLRALFIKRLIILRSQWWIYILALLIPIGASAAIASFLDKFIPPSCGELIKEDGYVSRILLSTSLTGNVIGPTSANSSIVEAVGKVGYYSPQWYTNTNNWSPVIRDSREDFLRYIGDHPQNVTSGGIFLGNTTAPIIAIAALGGGLSTAMALLNIANMVRSGVTIFAYSGYLKTYNAYSNGSGLMWITIFCLTQCLYPAFFALYPTYERRSQVRALQYSNGVRPVPLWLSHLLFDLMFVVLISVGCTAVIQRQAPFWALGHLFFVILLHGIAATLLAYLISMFSRSQPAALGFSILIMGIEYVVAFIVMTFIQGFSSSDLAAQDGATFGIGLIFPVQNLMRAAILSLNQNVVRCRGSVSIDSPSSIYAYSGPIVLLLIQIVAFFTLLIWVDGTTFSFSKPKMLQADAEKSPSSGRPDVDAETDRVMASPDDQLRMLHVSKRFGSQEAVSDVSLGLREGEILALLGPNGAGKTTAINMIRGDLSPSSGDVFLKGVNVHKNMRLAQKHLGVCPQFDALDLLTVREQLVFYARCKGVVDQKKVVDYTMAMVGISAHAKKRAAKLSGGNKRKLSLAIALIDNPPVLLLDEPSSAMDAASKRVLWATLRAVAPGRSVLITTHSMEEADALATRAAIISKKLLAIGSTQQLRERHSNELIVHLILKTAPLSSDEEMLSVADWVRNSFPAVQFEGVNLGGQVRFIVPADSEVPHTASTSGDLSATAVSVDLEGIAPQAQGRLAKSFWGYLVQTLEREKENLGLQNYTIGTATMERVFMSVVKESNLAEEEDEKKAWWRW